MASRPTTRVKVQARARVKVATIPKFPAQVMAGDGLAVAQSGGVFTFSLDPAFMPSFDSGTPYTVGDLLIADDASSIGALHAVATGNVLLSGGVASFPSWDKVGLATHVSGTLPIANGGTGQTSAETAFNALAPTTARGDIIARSATTNARLPIGAAGFHLQSDGTDVGWAGYAQAGSGAVVRTWQARLQDAYHANDYGTLAQAITAAAAAGKALYLPKGSYDITTLTIPTGMAILGESYQNTIIRTTTTTGNVITIGGNSVTIEGIQFQAASARASGWMIDATSVANFIVRDCLIGDANSPTQVLIGNGTSSIYIEDSTISAPINGVGLQVGNGAGTGGVDLKIRGTKFFSDAGAKAFANILLTNVSDLTLSDVTVIGAATNIAMSPATGQFVVFVKGDQVWSDSGTTGMNITPSGTGFVRDVTFANGWFGNNSNGIIVGRANTATVDGLNFENNTFLNSGSGVSADATAGGITNVRVSDGWASAHAASAFYFNNVSGVQLRHIHVGPYAGNAGNATGITLAGATDNVYISDVVATGNTTAAYTNTSSGTNINIHNSPGITATPWTVAEGGTNGSSASGTLLDNITGFASTGHLVRTAAGTYAFRSLTGPAAGISVSNGSGVSGNPTLALVNDLAALEGLGSTGIAVRTTTDTWVQRSIAGTANEITLMNGDGVSGNPTASLPTALTFTGKTVTGGTFAGPTFSGTIANLATVTTADINGGTVDGTVIGGASAAAATFTSLTTTGSRTGTVTSSAGSGVLVGDSFILTRTVTSGSSDITYAAQYKLTDSSGSSTSPLAAASLSVDALFQNAANTTTNYGIQMSGTAAANLTTYVSLATGFTVNGGSTLTNYTGLSIVAPSGTVTNKTAISVASGAGAIIQSDTTDATSTSDGSIRSAGGLSVAKNIIGGAKIRVGSYVVASLPAGSAGDMAFASNCRVFNGAGTQEGAGAGTGGLVTHNGTAWKIPGTNVTAVA